MNEYQKSSAHDLADILVQYGRTFDLYEYMDSVADPEQTTAEIETKLLKGDVEPFTTCLKQDIEETDDVNGLHAAAWLTLMLLYEYKESFFPSHSLDDRIAKANAETNNQTFELNTNFEPDRR